MPPSSTIPDYVHDSVRALPVLPTAVTRLLALARDVDADFGEIARVIETDQTLTARTLRAANSPLNAVSRRITTVRQATVLLGSDTIVNLVLGVSVMSLQSKLYQHLPIDAGAFGRHSVAVGLVARKLAQHFNVPNPGEAFVAGLLHDIGKLVLLMHHGEGYGLLMRRALEGDQPLHALERDTYDLDHALVGHVLCMHWNLPPAIAQAVAEHHEEPAPRSVADVVRHANDLIKTVGLGNGGNRFVEPARVGGIPRDQISHEVLRELVLSLPGLTREAEEALGHDARGAAADEEAASASRLPVQLQIRAVDEEEILAALLWSMGYEPIGMHDGSFSSNGRTGKAPVALLTCAPATDLQRRAYEQRAVPVLDYPAWRGLQGYAPGAAFDVVSLRAWLEEHIQEAIPQA